MHPALSNQIAIGRTRELARIAAANGRRPRPRRSLRARLGR